MSCGLHYTLESMFGGRLLTCGKEGLCPECAEELDTIVPEGGEEDSEAEHADACVCEECHARQIEGEEFAATMWERNRDYIVGEMNDQDGEYPPF